MFLEWAGIRGASDRFRGDRQARPVRFLFWPLPAARIDATGQADQIGRRFFVRSVRLRMRLALTTNLPFDAAIIDGSGKKYKHPAAALERDA